MARLLNTTAMTVDGVIDIADWFVAVGDHDDAARSLFETDDAAMLVGRKSFDGLAARTRRPRSRCGSSRRSSSTPASVCSATSPSRTDENQRLHVRRLTQLLDATLHGTELLLDG